MEDVQQDDKYGRYVEQRRAIAEAIFGKLNPPLRKLFLQYPIIDRIVLFSGIFHSKAHIQLMQLYVVHKIAQDLEVGEVKKVY